MMPIIICGTVKNRSGGHGTYSASVVMQTHSKWTQFIRSIENWDKVEHGTLTLDECVPLPNAALDSLPALRIEPSPDKLFGSDPTYVRLMKRRGERRFYRGIARAKFLSYAVLVSQQREPACEHRLEVYANDKLRAVLGVKEGDQVCVEMDSNQNPRPSEIA